MREAPERAGQMWNIGGDGFPEKLAIVIRRGKRRHPTSHKILAMRNGEMWLADIFEYDDKPWETLAGFTRIG